MTPVTRKCRSRWNLTQKADHSHTSLTFREIRTVDEDWYGSFFDSSGVNGKELNLRFEVLSKSDRTPLAVDAIRNHISESLRTGEGGGRVRGVRGPQASGAHHSLGAIKKSRIMTLTTT